MTMLPAPVPRPIRWTLVRWPLLWAAGALLATTGFASVRTAPLATAAPVAAPPAVPATELEPGALSPPTITAPPTAPDAIRPRPRGDAPRIETPPVDRSALAPRDQSAQAAAREWQQLLRRASVNGRYGTTTRSAQAAWLLGLIQLHGAGVRRDAAAAQLWFQRAASGGREPWAYAGIAWCAIDGCVGPPTPLVAERAIAQLRETHAARADYLAWLLAQRQTPLQLTPPGNEGGDGAPRPGLRQLQRSAAAGDVQALTELGLLAVSQNDLEGAAAYFRRAAPHSQAAAYNLSEVQARMSDRIQANPRTPLSASASEALEAARRYHRGVGVSMNYVEAIRLYRVAEARGSQEARRMLQLIFSQPAPGGGINVAWMRQLAFVDTASSLPVVGTVLSPHTLQRDPTPLFDLMPAFWRHQLTQVGR